MHVICRLGLRGVFRRIASASSITKLDRLSHSTTFSAQLHSRNCPPRIAFAVAEHSDSRPFSIMNGNTIPPTQSVEELTSSLNALGLSQIPSVPDTNSYPTFNQIDIYRSHITELLEPITGVSAKVIYPALQWTQTLDNGDLMLPVPALRIKAKKPDELAREIAEKVGNSVFFSIALCGILTKRAVPRLSTRSISDCRKDLCSFLLQARTTRQPRASFYPPKRPKVWLQP